MSHHGPTDREFYAIRHLLPKQTVGRPDRRWTDYRRDQQRLWVDRPLSSTFSVLVRLRQLCDWYLKSGFLTSEL